MKTDILESLVETIDLRNVLIKPEDVLLRIEGKGDLKNTFPIPDCDSCEKKCCPPRVAISLYDVARFIDMGMDDYITGMFEGYVALHLSDDGGSDIKLSYSYMKAVTSEAKDCIFLNEERKCSIYENRPYICRSYPVAVRIDEDRNRLGLWLGGCQYHKETSDESLFRMILNNAVQDYNEKLKSNALLMNRREELREFGFGRYMESEMRLLVDYDKKNKDMRNQMADMQQALDRLRAPQDFSTAIQRLQSDNDWLKERMVSLEKDSAAQMERAHSIISELTSQLSDQRKLMESFRQTEEQSRRGLWRK